MTRRTANNAGVTLRPDDGHNRATIRAALAATRADRKAERESEKARRRVGVVVPCGLDANVDDDVMRQAELDASAHFGGAPVRLVEREGLVFAGPRTHITFERTD